MYTKQNAQALITEAYTIIYRDRDSQPSERREMAEKLRDQAWKLRRDSSADILSLALYSTATKLDLIDAALEGKL